ncbi:MAG: TIGR03560 family F420-dependent LLM class oxidoreductase [Verrucomicrobiota bacterium]
MDRVRIGLKLAPQFTTVEELRTVWRIADEAGFDHCWNFDHFASIGTRGNLGDVFEGWTLLGAMAEATSRVRIGCMVTGNTYRHPGVLAKMAVTVDHLSGGRLDFGLGAAWAENEHTMLGLGFGTAGKRIARMEEACRMIKLLWSEDRASFNGEHYRLVDAVANPKPVQPAPPIWIGGSGERKTLRVVAEHADVWNVASGEIEEAVRLSGVLDGHCTAVGRDPAEVRRSVQLFYTDVETLLREAAGFATNGFRELVVGVRPGTAESDATEVAGVLPRLRSL